MPTSQATMKKRVTGSAVPIQRVQDDFEELRDILGAVELRAFELFERRDGQCGHDLDDWLAAEAELVYQAPVTIDNQADHVEVRIGLGEVSAQEIALFLTDQKLVVRGEARSQLGSERKWMLVRIDLPVGVNPDTAIAALESGEVTVILRKA
jgi:HSP20 family molecular chaperone IbpA